MENVKYLPGDYQRTMENNGSGAFWRGWQELGGDQKNFVSLETFTRPERVKENKAQAENTVRGFASGVVLDE